MDAADSTADFASLAEAWTAAGQPEPHERHPVVRRGEREVSPGTRFLVHTRDRWRCAWCWFVSEQDGGNDSTRHLEADHIIPWSAAGSDRSDNLRSLCNVCNANRSNFVTDTYSARARPCTIWCDPCLELCSRAGIDAPGSPYLHEHPWLLHQYMPSRWQVLQDVGPFDLEMPSTRIGVFCYYGNHISWLAHQDRIA